MLAIKQTLYRTSFSDDPALGGEEAVVRSLVEAAEAGKQVVVLVELKARFDEAANINWARVLESAGVHVVYGMRGLKTHAKTLLVVRKEPDGIKRYSHLGTGNYNPNTARLYEDLGLFTADADIGADLSELFNHLTGYARPTEYRKLIVAPEFLRTKLVERIREQADLGPDGRIMIKTNHVVDPDMIDELYAASSAGVKIDLIVRGTCSIRAGAPRPVRQHHRSVPSRPLPRTLEDLSFRAGGRRRRVLHRLRRPDAAAIWTGEWRRSFRSSICA